MGTSTLLTSSTTLIYLAASILYLTAMIGKKNKAGRLGRWCLLAGVIVHAGSFAVLHSRVGGTPVTSLQESLSFFAWCLVLPEYALNILALRIGYKEFTGGQMGAFRLCTGVFCIAMVSIYVLGEHMTMQKVIGFAIMGLSMILISSSDKKNEEQ